MVRATSTLTCVVVSIALLASAIHCATQVTRATSCFHDYDAHNMWCVNATMDVIPLCQKVSNLLTSKEATVTCRADCGTYGGTWYGEIILAVSYTSTDFIINILNRVGCYKDMSCVFTDGVVTNTQASYADAYIMRYNAERANSYLYWQAASHLCSQLLWWNSTLKF